MRALSCSRCGGPLRVPEGVRYVTCGYCDAQLEVQQEGAAWFTQILGRVASAESKAERAVDGVETLRVEQELRELEERWRSKYGGETLVPPSRTWSYAGPALSFASFGAWFLLMRSCVGGDSEDAIGAATILWASFGGIAVPIWAAGYRSRKRRWAAWASERAEYGRQRDHLLARLAQLRRGTEPGGSAPV